MKTYKITAADLDETGTYIGDLDFIKELDGHLDAVERGLVMHRQPQNHRIRTFLAELSVAIILVFGAVFLAALL